MNNRRVVIIGMTLRYAVDFIQTDRVKAVLVAASESLSLANFTGFSVLGFLAGEKGEEVSCPFDKRHNGIILGEAAGTIIIEDEEHAKARNAHIYAEVKGIHNCFDAYKIGKYHPDAPGLKKCMSVAIQKSGLTTGDISYISSSANSVAKQDKLETKAIHEIFGKKAPKIPVSSIKSMTGESFSASGLIQLIAGIGNMRYNFLSPTINYCVKDQECDLDYVPGSARKAAVNNILISNFGPGGNNAAAVLSKYH